MLCLWISAGGFFAYQTPQKITIHGIDGEALSATFEDSLVYANVDAVLKLNSGGIARKIQDALKKVSIFAYYSYLLPLKVPDKLQSV